MEQDTPIPAEGVIDTTKEDENVRKLAAFHAKLIVFFQLLKNNLHKLTGNAENSNHNSNEYYLDIHTAVPAVHPIDQETVALLANKHIGDQKARPVPKRRLSL